MYARIYLLVWATLSLSSLTAADWPQWGRDHTHNAVSPEKGLPEFQLQVLDEQKKVVKAERGVAWKAEPGTRTVVHPVVADGLVWVCTNVRDPEDEKLREKDWDGGVLMCLRESDGKLLWRHRTPRRKDGGTDFSHAALGSAPLVEGDRLWYTNNRHEVVCFDIGPLKKQTGEPKQLWNLPMMEKLGVFGRLPLMQSGFAASVAGYKDWLYVVTHNGIDEDYSHIPSPEAPSLICVEKATGKVVWKDNSPGKNILEFQMSSPLVAEINGKQQVIVGQGDGWLRSFDATSGKLIWKCDLSPKSAKWEIGGRGERNYVVATPVLCDNRIYIAPGQQNEHFDGPGCLYCIDPTKTGDVSRELDDGPGKGKPNPNSAVIWHTLGPFPDGIPLHSATNKKSLIEVRDYLFGRTLASCTVHDGLVYAADIAGYFFCFDAKAGKPYWIHDLKASVYAQPLWVDGKVLVATEDGDVWIFAHGKEKKQIGKLESDQVLRPGLVFANKTLYITGESTLFAIRASK